MNVIKEQLYKLCQYHLLENIKSAEAAISDGREASQNETKSSMGDKYETAREMLQQDIHINMARLQKACQEQLVLQQIDPEQKGTTVAPGSLVKTNNGWFYIAISASKMEIDEEIYYTISITSPLGNLLKGKTTGSSFVLNGKSYMIEKVY